MSKTVACGSGVFSRHAHWFDRCGTSKYLQQSPQFTDFPSLCAWSQSSVTNLIGSCLNLLCLQSHSEPESHWTYPEVVIFSADQTERGLCGRESPNASNMLSPTMCMLGYVVLKCCNRLVGASNLSQQHPRGCNTSQRVETRWPNALNMLRPTMLRWNVAIGWPGLKMVKFFMQHLWMLHDAVLIWPGSCNNLAPRYAF